MEPVQAPNTPQTVQPARGDEIALMVPCSKGCGVPLGVTNDMLELAKRANMPLDVKHEVCPGEEGAPLNKYRMAIEIYLIKPGEEAETLLTKMGDTLEGRSFAEVFDGFSNLIQSSWQQVEKVRHIVDQ